MELRECSTAVYKPTTIKSTSTRYESIDSITDQGPSRKEILVHIFVGVVACFGSIGPGMSLGYSAISLPPMTSTNGTLRLTPDQASWFASLASISTPLGCLLCGPILDRLGRKAGLLLVNVPCFLGWMILALVPSEGAGILWLLYTGRLLTGLSTGMTSIPGTIYLAEISATPPLRSILVTWTSIFIAAGILIVYSLGAIFQTNWRLVAAISALFPVISFFLTLILLPESPVWLISKEKHDRALKSLTTLRVKKSSDTKVQSEFDQMLSDHQQTKRTDTKTSLLKTMDTFLRPEAWKPFVIMNLFFFFQQTSGIFVVIFYAVDIVHEAGVTIDIYLATVLIGAMRFIVSIVVSVLSKRFGRRPTAIISGVGMTVCMSVLSLYLYLDQAGGMSSDVRLSLSWIPVTFLLLYIVMSTYGFLTLPWAMLGEMYPSKIRGVAGGVTTSVGYLFGFLVIKVYPNMLELLGKHGVFLFFGIMGLLGTLFVVFFLPETHGKNELDMKALFNNKHNEITLRRDSSTNSLHTPDEMKSDESTIAQLLPINDKRERIVD